VKASAFVPVLIVVKLLGALAIGALLYRYMERGVSAWAEEGDSPEDAQSASDEKSASNLPQSAQFRLLSLDDVPKIPDGKAGLADYTRIRAQLELMKQEVEEKIVRLKLATDAYRSAQVASDEKLKIIREEAQLLDETLQKEKEVQKERIEEALVFIEKMEPKKAAPVLESMDRDLVVQLFKKLKPKTVTKFLESMRPAKATEYMEYYTKIRSGREFELLRDLKMCEGAEFADDVQDVKQ
jgi:flagellar motility protein MotE (MotC chaperone)